MTLLSEPSVRSDRLVFAQNFGSRRMVQDGFGVLVGCSVGLRGPGIIPTAASSRVTYDRTQSLLINASQMTVRTRIRTPAAFGAGGNLTVLAKTPSGLVDNQFMIEMQVTGRFLIYVANAAGDASQFAYPAVLNPSREYLIHIVYNGGLAAGSRVIFYIAGLPVATTIGGTIPSAMRAGASPITIFQRAGGTLNCPPTDFTIFDTRIWSTALDANEVLDDALARTYGVI
jgi:hypothetical protein